MALICPEENKLRSTKSTNYYLPYLEEGESSKNGSRVVMPRYKSVYEPVMLCLCKVLKVCQEIIEVMIRHGSEICTSDLEAAKIFGYIKLLHVNFIRSHINISMSITTAVSSPSGQ